MYVCVWVYTYLRKRERWDLLEWLTDYSPENTMAGCKNPVVVQFIRRVSRLVFTMCWDPEDIGSNASEEMDVLPTWGQVVKEQKLPSFMSLGRFPADVAQIKGVSYCLVIWIKDKCLPDSISKLKVGVFLSQRLFLPKEMYDYVCCPQLWPLWKFLFTSVFQGCPQKWAVMLSTPEWCPTSPAEPSVNQALVFFPQSTDHREHPMRLQVHTWQQTAL